MDTLKERTVGEIVADDYRTAGVFKKFGLDFCCGGGKTVVEACERKGIDLDTLLNELNAVTAEKSQDDNYNEWSPDFLIDYIVNNHHRFVRNKLPEIEMYSKKVAKVHGSRHPEVKKIYHEFTKLHTEMINHLHKEEEILFPYIRHLVDAEKNGQTPEKPAFGEAANPIAMMEHEHEEAGEAMENIKELSNDFNPPEDACATYRVLFKNLEGFQEDLHKHVHLENNILFPKALEMEKRLN